MSKRSFDQGPLTADTITDEQIRELQSLLRADSAALSVDADRSVEKIGAIAWTAENAKITAAFHSTRVALAEKRANRGDSRANARARCAEILNARGAK